MGLKMVLAGFALVCLSAQSLAAETLSCWYDASGHLTGADAAQGNVGSITRTGKGDRTASYLISAFDGNACPMALPGNASHGLTAYLVRHDAETNCTNDGVQATPSNVGGTVSVFYVGRNKAQAVVRLTDASPATLYRLDHKCTQKLGNVKADLSGEAVAIFDFVPRRGRTMAFTMNSRGAPAGDRYQSVGLTF